MSINRSHTRTVSRRPLAASHPVHVHGIVVAMRLCGAVCARIIVRRSLAVTIAIGTSAVRASLSCLRTHSNIRTRAHTRTCIRATGCARLYW